jgi:hypothetical protein
VGRQDENENQKPYLIGIYDATCKVHEIVIILLMLIKYITPLAILVT